MTAVIRIAGQALGGLGIIIYWLCRGAWWWFTGTPRSDDPAKQRVTRPVRAALQSCGTAAVLALVWWPVPTLITLAVLTLALLGAVAAVRLRRWLGRRVVVEVGEPIRPKAPPIDVEVIELPWEDRAATTRRLARQLEAAA